MNSVEVLNLNLKLEYEPNRRIFTIVGVELIFVANELRDGGQGEQGEV